MFAYGCTFVFLCICTGLACVCVGGGGETRKDVTCEALQKAGQIMPGNPCIHVSALWVWGLQRERVKARQVISGHAVSVSCDSVWSQLLSCLLPNLPTVIHPAWHGVLVTAMPNPPRCQEEHSIPSTDRVYWLPCQRPYHTIRLLDWLKFYSGCPGCVYSQQMTFKLWLVYACWTGADSLTNGYFTDGILLLAY